MATLVVAEKPSVARDIARVLGASRRGEGYLTGGDYVVTWAVGHLVTLKEPEEIDERYKRWRREDLPILPDEIPLKVIPKTRPQYKVVKALMNGPETERIVCATDSGREGELIFRYIYEMAKCTRPVDRLWISSMTDEAIREGFARLEPDSRYDALYASARLRAQADWLVGMNLSRAFTLRYDVLLSVGRVQTPTLQMLVARRREIDAFVPEAYWTVQADFGDYKGTWFDPEKDGEKRIGSAERAEQIAAQTRGGTGEVAECGREQRRELPPLLYDLTSLQRDANNALGFTASRTLKAAQNLYEKHKLITYPRTDSRYLPHDMAGKAAQAMRALPAAYAPLTARLPERLPMTRRVFDDAKISDHHAIVPTGRRTDVSGLPADEGKLYDLVCRRLIAAFYPAYEYDALRVVTRVKAREGTEAHAFLSTGRAVTQSGWKDVYRDVQPRRKKGEEEEAPLPPLSVGDARAVRRATVKEERTKPPREHTDASILREMENAGRRIEDEELRESMKDSGLGTPATRAAVIERLIDVGYAARKGRALTATPKGVRLIEAVPESIASPETTGRWERELSRIARGEADGARFMEGIVRLTRTMTQYAASGAPDVAFEPEARRGKGKSRQKDLKIPCPLCGQGTITENSRAFGCSRWREGCKFTLWKDGCTRAGGPELTEKLLRAVMEKKRLTGSTGVLTWDGKHVLFVKRTDPM